MENQTPPTEPSAADVIEVRTLAANLHQLADLIADTPGLAPAVRYAFGGINCYVMSQHNPRAVLAAVARAGLKHGAHVTKDIGDYAGVVVRFGEVGVHVYAARGEVCERIVTGTREVTKEVPDPDALAAVPKVTVTETVEDVEWKCTPLLAVES